MDAERQETIVYSAGLVPEATGDLPSLVRQLLEFSVPCGGAVGCNQPATRQIHGELLAKRGRQFNTTVLCDKCSPPDSGIFARYDWGQAFDLPYAGVLRALAKILDKPNVGQ